MSTRKVWKESLPVCKTLKDKDGNRIDFLGDVADRPFVKGNHVNVNGKAMLVSRHRIGGIIMMITKGRISGLKVAK